MFGFCRLSSQQVEDPRTDLVGSVLLLRVFSDQHRRLHLGAVWKLRLSQNGFTGEATKNDFIQLLVSFYPDLQNTFKFILQYLDLRETDEADAGRSSTERAQS